VRSSLCASPKYRQEIGEPAHPRDLVNDAFAIYPLQKSVVVTNGKTDFEVPMTSRVRVRTDSFAAINELTILGGGISWLADFITEDAMEAGRLVRVLPQWQPKYRGPFYFVYASHRYALPKVEGFIQTALEMDSGPPARFRGPRRSDTRLPAAVVVAPSRSSSSSR
jgi:DNA-binding transcriptional LysR family regulator